MGPSKNNNWTGQHSMHNLKNGGGWIFDDMETVDEMIPRDYLDLNLVEIQRFMEPSPDIEDDVSTTALKVGLGGVGVVCAAGVTLAAAPAIGGGMAAAGLFGKAAAVKGSAAAIAAAETAAGVIGVGAKCAGVGGAAMAMGGAVLGATAPFYNFHDFIVFECSNGFWLSVEKNEKHVVLQISKERDDIISYKDGVEHTRDSGIVLRAKSPVKRRGRNGVFRVKDLLAEVIGTAAYNLITSNCHHFAGQMMNTYARDPVGCTGEKKAD